LKVMYPQLIASPSARWSSRWTLRTDLGARPGLNGFGVRPCRYLRTALLAA